MPVTRIHRLRLRNPLRESDYGRVSLIERMRAAHSSLLLPLSLCAVAISVESREEPPLASVLIWDGPRACALGRRRFFAVAELSAATQLSPSCSCRALARPLHRLLLVLVLEPWLIRAWLRGTAPSGGGFVSRPPFWRR